MNTLRSTKVAAIISDASKLQEIGYDNGQTLIEFRVDLDPSLMDSLAGFPLDQTILTYRSAEEGGKGENTFEKRKAILEKLVQFKPYLMDIELNRDLPFIEDKEVLAKRLLISSHDYSTSMEEASRKYLTAILALPKIFRDNVTFKFVGKPTDALDFFLAYETLKHLKRHVVLAIGRNGEASRTLKLNQQFVFGSLEEMEGILRFNILQKLHTSMENVYLGLIGRSLSHLISLSIKSIFCKYADRTGYYHLFEVSTEKRLEQILPLLSRYGIRGINVTFPYKEKVVELSDVRDKCVDETGSANTLKFEGDKISAYNTDISGFIQFMDDRNLSKLENAVIVGAGGAAKSIAYALVMKGFSVYVFNRTKERYNAFPNTLKEKLHFLHSKDELKKADLYINATPVGLDGTSSPTDIFPFPKGLTAAIDIAYGTNETGLLKEANKFGISSYDGKEMLFHQAADAFEIWTGEELERKSLMEKWLKEISK